jgi:hypothetical protein
VSPPPKKMPGATLVAATGREDYGAAYKFLRCIQRPFFAAGWLIERQCARIETAHELAKWKRDLEGNP